MAIGGIDASVSKKLAIQRKRKSIFEQFQTKKRKSQDLALKTCMISNRESSTDHESDATEDDPDYLETSLSQKKKKIKF